MKLKGKNVLITGGAGFIGSHLVDRIIKEQPNNVVVVDSFFLGCKENLDHAFNSFPELRLYRMDASNFADMLHLVKKEKIEVVFNLAVVPLPTSLEFPTWTIRTNIDITSTFCELARRGCIDTLVHSSSSEAYGSAEYIPMDEKHPLKPCTPYAASKAGSDHTVLSYSQTYHIDTVIVRPFNNFGPRQNKGSYAGIIPIVINRISNGLPVEIFGDGEQTRDFIFVRDTANAFIKVYEEERTRGKIINIASGKETTINSLVSMIATIMDDEDYPREYSQARSGDVRRHCGSVELLQMLTGFESPAITSENLSETVKWYLKEIKK